MSATRYNKEQFIAWRIRTNGGSYQNAWRVWATDVYALESRDLSKPFDPPPECLPNYTP